MTASPNQTPIERLKQGLTNLESQNSSPKHADFPNPFPLHPK
jgi:hypothetical protein